MVHFLYYRKEDKMIKLYAQQGTVVLSNIAASSLMAFLMSQKGKTDLNNGGWCLSNILVTSIVMQKYLWKNKVNFGT